MWLLPVKWLQVFWLESSSENVPGKRVQAKPKMREVLLVDLF